MIKDIVICVDFDGTVVTHRYPKIGEPMPLAFEVLRALKAAGAKLILWTCREDHPKRRDRWYLTDAVEYCRGNGVEFDAVNETLHEMEFRHEDSLKRKPHAHYYIDDSILGGFIGWAKVAEFFDLKLEEAA